jgi:antitoxin StbD
MVSVRASDLAKNFGEWHDKAMSEPVIITKHSRTTAVLLSAQAYEMLLANYCEVSAVEDLKDDLATALVESEIPEKYRWDPEDKS